MKSLIDEYNPSSIIIEPTGIGKLSDVIRTIDMLKKYKGVELNISMAIIDPIQYEDFIEIFGDFFSDQTRHATTIINMCPKSLTSLIAVNMIEENENESL